MTGVPKANYAIIDFNNGTNIDTIPLIRNKISGYP